jgi:hypothetical protein
MELQVSDGLSIDAQEMVTGRTCVIAQSGAGKSYLIAVLCEKMLEAGVPFVIIDTEGEYFSLKEKFQLLWAGGPEADLNLERINLRQLAERAVRNGVPLILDVSESLDEKVVVSGFCQALYDAATKARMPYLLVIEEADKFAPQAIGKDERTAATLKIVEEIARRGRKRGLGLLIATQRPAMVSKNVLSQCGSQLIGKLTTENDLAAVNLFFSSRKELEELPKLQQGEFFAMGGLAREKVRFKSFPRVTQHKGLTPKLMPRAAGKISELKSELAGTRPEPVSAVPGEKGASRPVFGVPLGIERKRATEIAEGRSRRSFVVFGEKEQLVSLDLVWEPLVYVEAKLPGGLLRRELKTVSFMIDATTGKLADVNKGLRLDSGFEDIVGLSENEARVLLSIEEKGTTMAELQGRTGLSESALRDLVKKLRSARLLTWLARKNINYYSPLVRIRMPDLDRKAVWPAAKFEARGEVGQPKLTEESLRSLLKAVEPRAEITDFRAFYYPIWRARLQSKDARALRIDGVTGKEV